MRPHVDLELAEYRVRTANNDITGLQRADAFGRASIEQIARIERIELGGELDQPPAIATGPNRLWQWIAATLVLLSHCAVLSLLMVTAMRLTIVRTPCHRAVTVRVACALKQ